MTNRPAIPEPIKRAVRQRDGFGCVICGFAIYEYEHLDDYAKVQKHEIDNLTLLCHQCHGKVTRGFYSKEKVKKAMNDPKCKQNGYTREVLEYSDKSRIVLASNRFMFTQIPLQVRSIPIIWIKSGNENEPAKLNANFFDNNGKLTLKIIDNEWIADVNNWDIKTEGGKIIVKSSPNKVNLVLDFKTQSPNILINKIDMNIMGNKIIGNEKILNINGSTHGNCHSIGCMVGFQIN